MRFWPSLGIAFGIFASGFSAQAASAAELFEADIAARGKSGLLAPSKTIKRQRLVMLSESVLADAVIPPGSDTAADRAVRSRQRKGKFSVRLFDDLRIDLQRVSVEAAFESGVIWNGASTAGDAAILVVNGGRVTGSIERDGRHFLIEPVGEGQLHRIKEIDTEAYPKDLHKTPPGQDKKSEGTQSRRPAESAATTPTEVTLLVAYTALAKNQLGSTFRDKIKLDVSRTNTALANSGVDMKLRIVGFAPVWAGYNELGSSDWGEPLDSITSGTAYNFGNIRHTRDTLAADLVTFYTVRPEYCGLAWVNYPALMAAYAYSVINADCQGSLTLAHELGHNMGLEHDRYVVASPGPSSQYNYGFVSLAGAFRTIMSYSDACSDRSINCTEISYYSTPLKFRKGRAVGIAQYKEGAADGARLLRENTAGVSRFR